MVWGCGYSKDEDFSPKVVRNWVSGKLDLPWENIAEAILSYASEPYERLGDIVSCFARLGPRWCIAEQQRQGEVQGMTLFGVWTVQFHKPHGGVDRSKIQQVAEKYTLGSKLSEMFNCGRIK